MGSTVWGLISDRKTYLTVPQNDQTGSGANPPCYLMNAGIFSLRIKRPGVKLIAYIPLMSSIRISGVIPLLLLYAS
jgi:hypothetical protein